MLEGYRDSFTIPEACRDDGAFSYILATQISGDAELTDRSESFGMPAFLAPFNLTRQDTQGVRTWEWKWQVEGEGESSLTFYDDPPDVIGTLTVPHRFYWFNETAVTYADIQTVSVHDQVSALAPMATGMVSAPMMYANSGNPVYAGTGEIHYENRFSGTVHQFRDLECKEPIES